MYCIDTGATAVIFNGGSPSTLIPTNLHNKSSPVRVTCILIYEYTWLARIYTWYDNGTFHSVQWTIKLDGNDKITVVDYTRDRESWNSDENPKILCSNIVAGHSGLLTITDYYGFNMDILITF